MDTSILVRRIYEPAYNFFGRNEALVSMLG